MTMNPECWWKCAGSVPNSPRPANSMLHEEHLSELDSNKISPAFDNQAAKYLCYAINRILGGQADIS